MTKEELIKLSRENLRKSKQGSLCECYDEAFIKGYQLSEKRIAELEAQIEKMKCWCNCKNYLSCLEECCRKNISFEQGICYNCKKWELRR